MKYLKTFESFKLNEDVNSRKEELRKMIDDLDLNYLKQSAKTEEDYLKLVEDEIADLQPGDDVIVKQLIGDLQHA